MHSEGFWLLLDSLANTLEIKWTGVPISIITPAHFLIFKNKQY